MRKYIALLLMLLMGYIGSSQNVDTCPQIDTEQSNPYYILLTSTEQLNANRNIQIEGLHFVPAGNWYSNGTYFTSWTNTSGSPLDLTNFNIKFGNKTCEYSITTLSSKEFSLGIDFPLGIKYNVFNISGQLIKSGVTDNKTIQQLPNKQVIILLLEGYKAKKLIR